MKQLLIYNQNVSDSEQHITTDVTHPDIQNNKRAESSLFLPSLNRKSIDRDEPGRSSVFKNRSFSTQGIKKK